MKILFIAMASSAHTIKWVNYFRDTGYDIMLVSFYPSDEIKGLDFRHIPCWNKNFAIFKIAKVKRLIKQFKPDIIHAHFATSCGLVAALTGFHPYVLSVWGDDILEFPRRSPIHKWVVKKAIMDADYVTATSNMLAKKTKVLIKSKKKIQVIPFGVNLSHYSFKMRSIGDELHIGTVRNLTPKYGLDILIKAVAVLLNSFQKIRLTIVGDGMIRQKLESLVDRLGIKNNVAFTGFVPNEKVVEYLNKFDIFVMPSVGEGESFGVAAVEAMATGLPVVASNVGGLPEVVDDGKTGMLVKPGDVEDLKRALEFYIFSRDARIEHGKKGREKVKKLYNWKDNAKEMNNLYKEILSKTNS